MSAFAYVLNEFVFMRLCDGVGDACVSPVRVRRKTPIQGPECVWEGGALFHTQPVGNSSPSPLVVASFAYPAILHSLFSHAA